MSQESLYVRRAPSFSSKLFGLAPEAFTAFGEFNKQALAEGALTVRVKELIAVGITHITGCPYCIEAHTGKAKAEQASLSELAEVIAVAAAVNAHASYYHGVNLLAAYEGGHPEGSDLYPLGNLARVEKLAELNPHGATSFERYVDQALKPGKLTEKEKLLIAVGAAFVTGGAYSIEIFTAQAKAAGVTLQEIAEALLVAAVLNAGAVVGHRVNALHAYERVSL
ncbi:carboxymuconolactone decarboxylase family protein [Cohnella faecalis]|uniref:Alkylhydroperoxidase n=1 Tax=Cohnella faecalis TaxID=2315694 RepID=A0A398CS50_9BACL|nr:carboxymuconolactone decarboxylase family protein [Cohnella faecalis]RIE05030.1 alkylhydroperoxidase [Cohnella faecalis]